MPEKGQFAFCDIQGRYQHSCSPPRRGGTLRRQQGARMAVNKIYPDAQAALAGLLRDDMTIMSGGFGLCGIPAALIEAIRESGVQGT